MLTEEEFETLLRAEHRPATALEETMLARITQLEEFCRTEARIQEMQAELMRDPMRTGGWSGAKRVADAFERSAIRHREILENQPAK